jgi:membrane peptidoglycan carboxypeptidase
LVRRRLALPVGLPCTVRARAEVRPHRFPSRRRSALRKKRSTGWLNKKTAEKKKKTTITAESFDKQVANKMGEFFSEVFLPSLKKLVEAGLSYDEVKRLVKIPTTWGAKIKGSYA